MGNRVTAPFTRRDFLKGAAGATGLGLGGCLSSDNGSSEPPFDTVVVLMMENRSFDHMLGWLPGANGRQHGLTYPDRNHVQPAAWPLGDDV